MKEECWNEDLESFVRIVVKECIDALNNELRLYSKGDDECLEI
jgi:hypothetical protein